MAASINPIDVKRADGVFKYFGEKRTFPSPLGYDAAGIVTEVATGVTGFHVGDEVYACLSENETRASFLHFIWLTDVDEAVQSIEALLRNT